MQEQAASAAGANASARSRKYWAFADEETLVRGMLTEQDPAWLEFMSRFDSLITARVERVLVRRGHRLPWTDLVTRIHGDLTAYLEGVHMEPLRGFDPRHGTLANWVGRLADQLTVMRLDELTVPASRRRKGE